MEESIIRQIEELDKELLDESNFKSNEVQDSVLYMELIEGVSEK